MIRAGLSVLPRSSCVSWSPQAKSPLLRAKLRNLKKKIATAILIRALLSALPHSSCVSRSPEAESPFRQQFHPLKDKKRFFESRSGTACNLGDIIEALVVHYY